MPERSLPTWSHGDVQPMRERHEDAVVRSGPFHDVADLGVIVTAALPQRISRPQRQFRLNRGHRMNVVRKRRLLDGDFTEPQCPHLAGGHQLRHRSPRLFEWYLIVDAVQVVKVDHIDTEPAKTGVTGPT